ncbi:hypothetical protein N7451_011898 [Penicillium sp. IBT 35674x]|nr:hypothetical protein N7451_011898 [Penicillium sp. IBT 35674x]
MSSDRQPKYRQEIQQLATFSAFGFLVFFPTFEFGVWSSGLASLALCAHVSTAASRVLFADKFVKRHVTHRVPMRIACVINARWVERWSLPRREL